MRKLQSLAASARCLSHSADPKDMWLIFGNLARGQILHNRIRSWPLHRNTQELRSAKRIQQDITRGGGISGEQQIRIADRDRPDYTQVDIQVICLCHGPVSTNGKIGIRRTEAEIEVC